MQLPDPRPPYSLDLFGEQRIRRPEETERLKKWQRESFDILHQVKLTACLEIDIGCTAVAAQFLGAAFGWENVEVGLAVFTPEMF